MTWQSAKSAAAPHVKIMLERLRSAGANACTLAEYEDEACYNFLKPGEEWSFEFHRMIIRAITRELRCHGIKVRVVILKLNDYFDFIAKNDLENNEQSRAMFAASIK